MPDRYMQKLLLGYPLGFWLAVIAVALVQARAQNLSPRATLASTAVSAVLAGAFAQGAVDHWSLSPSPFVVAAVGSLIGAVGPTVLRVIVGIRSINDLTAAAAELLRAWRGVK